jgi:hypothetical protein
MFTVTGIDTGTAALGAFIGIDQHTPTVFAGCTGCLITAIARGVQYHAGCQSQRSGSR